MKPGLFITLAVLFAGTLLSHPKPETVSINNAQFDKMKLLTGNWKGTDEEGKPVTITYRIVSGGSAIMESLEMAGQTDAMVTMYHVNGSKLMMTHYCSLGNQPRMKAVKSPVVDSSITFSYMDATNLATIKQAHMSKLVVTFIDDDHFSQDWTMSKDGKEAHHAIFKFERVK